MKPSFRDILPEYPSTLHLPWNPNNKGDRVAMESDAACIFEGDNTCVQEKIDGANCGMAYLEGHPVIRSRSNILRKGQEMKNPSQAQFASSWNWMHENKSMFDALENYGPYSVYGEWMVQQHGMMYDVLPDWFIAFDIYDWEKRHYIDPKKASDILKNCGFFVVPTLLYGKVESYKILENLANIASSFASEDLCEGIVVKVSSGDAITARFKMVRQGFDQGCLLGDIIKRNKLQ